MINHQRLQVLCLFSFYVDLSRSNKEEMKNYFDLDKLDQPYRRGSIFYENLCQMEHQIQIE